MSEEIDGDTDKLLELFQSEADIRKTLQGYDPAKLQAIEQDIVARYQASFSSLGDLLAKNRQRLRESATDEEDPKFEPAKKRHNREMTTLVELRGVVSQTLGLRIGSPDNLFQEPDRIEG